MLVYRVAHSKHIADLAGTGGLYTSGRWHALGTRLLYTSGTLSLAKLEVLANSLITPINQALLILEVPDDIPQAELKITDLPANWKNYPAPNELAALAAAWIRQNRHLVLKVPSAQAELESNYLINPQHPNHHRLQIVEILPHHFDPRLKESLRQNQ
jgi:RES domain-containing protein